MRKSARITFKDEQGRLMRFTVHNKTVTEHYKIAKHVRGTLVIQ